MDVGFLDEIHAYWFGELKSPTDHPKEKSEIWFKQSDATDAHIRDTFAHYLDEARDRDWNVDDLTRQQRVALIILFDQFPRNIFRQSGDAFAYDEKAREIARQIVARGLDRLWYAERTFALMPFMHSEDIADQDRCVWLFAGEALSTPEELKDGMRNALDFATRHRDVIRKFGRFPHRNEMLGRESTEEELEFLKGGRGF